MSTTIPVCPLLSIGSDKLQLCVQDQCGWYVAPVKKCALMVMGHQSAVTLHQQQQKPKA